MKNLKLGIFGFGCVGQGLYHVLQQSNSINSEIVKICIKDLNKPRSLEAAYFTDKKDDLLQNEGIDVIVELIDDAEAAFEIVSTAMNNGKSVVSANKKMIAEHLEELLELQEKNNVSLLYEASCCASIPIIRNLEEYYDNDLLSSLEGIFNGSTNFILSKLIAGGQTYDEVLKEAQDLGFAESDPTLDVEGIDPKYKLCILLFHAFGLVAKPDDVFNYGISKINDFDIDYAKKRGLTIKLISKCRREGDKIEAYCLPTFIPIGSVLSQTSNEYNAVVLESAFSESQLLYGKGAGDKPTGSAVLSDISALNHDYKYEYKKKAKNEGKFELCENFDMRLYVRYNGSSPDFNDFESIEEKYQSDRGNFLVGTIKLKKLKNSRWLKDSTINTIVLN
ncbi:homoserine dehydrogenase [Reichenbachiella faecimaris]|uniref:Homoserine dehydrogenase n=1 Tax=Reichenbachiella faecimaris TaxID=692418 RepID=A0A1W2GIN1_REIFA|nr:homoserine dehydrogenase [Reichenbachiella faecimaris]SMD36507.1 homoserine dehydrogenase [Reichenbachiella faecimaris]